MSMIDQIAPFKGKTHYQFLEDLAKRVDELQRREQEMSLRKISHMADMSAAQLSQMFRMGSQPSYVTILKLAKFFNDHDIPWEVEKAIASAHIIPATAYFDGESKVVYGPAIDWASPDPDPDPTPPPQEKPKPMSAVPKAIPVVDTPVPMPLTTRMHVYNADEAARYGTSARTVQDDIPLSSTMRAYANVYHSSDATWVIIDTALTVEDNHMVLARYNAHIVYGIAKRMREAKAEILGRVTGFYQKEPDPYDTSDLDTDSYFAPADGDFAF